MLSRWSTSFASLLVALGLSTAGCGGASPSVGKPDPAMGLNDDASVPGADDGGAMTGPPSDAATAVGADGGPVVASNVWVPSSAGPIHFHWELGAAFRVPNDVIAGQGPIVYDIDGEKNNAATVSALHALGSNVKVVCYVDVGTRRPAGPTRRSFPRRCSAATWRAIRGRSGSTSATRRRAADHEGPPLQLVQGQGLRRRRAGQPRRLEQQSGLPDHRGRERLVRSGHRVGGPRARAFGGREEPNGRSVDAEHPERPERLRLGAHRAMLRVRAVPLLRAELRGHGEGDVGRGVHRDTDAARLRRQRT